MSEQDKDKQIQQQVDHSFGKVIMIFIDHIESLVTTLPLVLTTISQTREKAIKLHQEFLNRDCEKKTDEKGEYYIIKPEQFRRNKLLRKEVVKSNIAFRLVQRNFIVSLVSQFDSFVGSLIRTMFYVKPELLNDSEKQLTFSNLVQFADIASAREFIIEKEIESVLRESHTFHFKWLEKKLDATLRKDLEIWSTFIELTERRNLYVHTDGVVSNQYLKNCNENNVQFKTEPKIGDTLEIDPDYFEKAFACIFELGIKLGQVMWRKLLPKDLKDADVNLLNISYELIQNNQYDLALTVLDFSDKYIKKFSSEDIKLRICFNRAQAYKWQGNTKKCEEIIKALDLSACSSVFKLAGQVLLDDFENAAKTMKLIGADSKDIEKNDYKEWPIFREFRKQKVFETTFQELYKETVEGKDRFASSGFKIIDHIAFHEHLQECFDNASKRTNGFLSSKFFIETYLASRGYDIGASWEHLKKLEQDGVIEMYRHEDPDGKFPPISAIRKKVGQ